MQYCCSIMMVTDAVEIIYSGWSWWWRGSNRSDELARMALTLSFAVFVITWYMLVTRNLRGARPPLPPGPRGLPLVGSLPFLESDLHCYFAKLAHTYGPIMKLKLGSKLWIVLSSPSLAKEVLKDKDTIFSNRDVTPTSFVTSYGCSDIAWAPYGPHWRMVRKVCLRGMLCNKSLDACYDIRRRETRRMVKDIYSKVGMQINIAEQMFLNTLNVIMSMLWGSTIESEERTSDLLEFRQVVGEMIEVLGMSNISDYFPILARFDIQGMEGRMKNLVSWLDRVFDTVIDQRLKMNKAREEGEKNMKEHKDFLQLLLELEEGDPNKPIIKPLLLVRIYT
ncbi:hypothetical protein HHK36_028825 [Tetracentron sinense]|uniref:Cytochrome P450 n=1 Tax=Tetracentron sinense TaxID=13715 RepID=A0A835D2Z7_TETSI|nr:hypothetical protein HHK36_028825 [Tetracentron sinense]